MRAAVAFGCDSSLRQRQIRAGDAMRFVTAGSNALRSNALARHDGLCLQLDAERGSMEAGRQLASILRPLGPKKRAGDWLGIVCLSSKHSRVVKIKFHNRSPKVAELAWHSDSHSSQAAPLPSPRQVAASRKLQSRAVLQSRLPPPFPPHQAANYQLPNPCCQSAAKA